MEFMFIYRYVKQWREVSSTNRDGRRERERERRKWSKLNLITVEIKPGKRKTTRKKQMDNDQS